MAKGKGKKIVHVDNLIIHAENVEVVSNQQREGGSEENSNWRERDPWGFFWGWQPREEAREEAVHHQENESDGDREE